MAELSRSQGNDTRRQVIYCPAEPFKRKYCFDTNLSV